MTGQSTVSGTISAYAGGSIQAIFQPQGGGQPAVLQNSAPIAANGTFSLLAWDNTNALYAPSATVFLIQVGEKTNYSATVVVTGTSESITTAFASAPVPNGSVAGVAVTNTPSASGKVLTSTSTTAATWQ